MVHAVEIQIPLVQRSKERVGEIDVSIAPDHDIVGRIETLPFEFVDQDFDPPLAIGPGYPPGLILAGVQASLPVHGISICAVGILPINFRRLARNVFVEPVLAIVAEDQKPLARPYRPLAAWKAARKIGCHLRHLQV